MANNTSEEAPKVVADQRKLNAHPATRARLEAIGDPLERFLEASKIANRCWRKHSVMTNLRQRRREAVVALYRFHDINKAEIARLMKAKDRRVVDYAFGNKKLGIPTLDLRSIPKELQEDEALALHVAKKSHADYVKREAMGVTAREMRRILVNELTKGTYGTKYQNTELADMIGKTTPLIAQQRTDSSNRTKQANRAAKRRRKLKEAVAA